jgi:hypothetical protein
MGASGAPARARLYFTAILAVGLLAGVLIVVLGSSGGSSGPTPADEECLEAWNDDPAQVAFGQHQFNGHGYSRVEILRVASDGGELPEGEGGLCAVVFAAEALDPEPGAAAQVLRKGRWGGLASLPKATPTRLAELQSAAVGAANASLEGEGTLIARPAED